MEVETKILQLLNRVELYVGSLEPSTEFEYKVVYPIDADEEIIDTIVNTIAKQIGHGDEFKGLRVWKKTRRRGRTIIFVNGDLLRPKYDPADDEPRLDFRR